MSRTKYLTVFMMMAVITLLFMVSSAWAAISNAPCCPDGTQAYKNPLQVYVYDLDTNKPIKNAAVTLARGSYKVKDWTNSKGMTGIITGASQTGTYTITVTKDSYLAGTSSITITESKLACEPMLISVGLDSNPCEPLLKVCVYDATTNTSITGAHVVLTGPDYEGNKDTISGGCTNEFAGLKPGTYTATVNAAGYKTNSVLATIGANDCGMIEVPVGLVPECECSLKVYVFDEDNNKIAGAHVTLTGPDFEASKDTGLNGWTGEFSGDLKPGIYTASVVLDGYYPASKQRTLAQNECGLFEINVPLKRIPVCESSLVLSVSDTTTMQPVQGASATITGPEGTYNGTTGSDGKINFGSLPAGQYTASVTHKDYEKVTESTFFVNECDSQLIKISLKPICCTTCVCKNTIQVYVYDDNTGMPIRGAVVKITGPGAYSVSDYTGSKGQTGLLSGANMSGIYTITATKSGFVQGTSTLVIEKTQCGKHIVKLRLDPV